MPEVILISDGEDDPVMSKLAGPSRLRAPIFIDDSDDDDVPPSPTLSGLMAAYSSASVGDRKGKRKAVAAVATTRSGLLDLLDDDSIRLDTPPSDNDVPLATKKKRATSKKGRPPTALPDEATGQTEKEWAAARRAEEREAAKLQEKADKLRQKDEVKAAKEAAKSLAKKEREVNKLRVSKNDTVREIHLYLSPDLLSNSSPLAGALPEIRIRIEGNESQIHTLSEDAAVLPGMIRFKRHIKAKYDGALKRWIPLSREKWEWEPTVLLVITAEEIIDTIAGSTASDGLVQWAIDARMTLGLRQQVQMLIMIKGLNKYYNKTKAIAAREFTAAARAGLGERDSVRRDLGVRPDKERVEKELVELQVAERCFLVHVEKTEDIEDWIFNLAADIAIRPYKLLQKAHLNFCPADGVKKGSTPLQTFELMLQEVQGITPSAAAGIGAEYHTFRALMEAYERAERRGGSKAEEMLQDCEIRNLRNGTLNGRRLNKALSKRVYQVFRGEDSLALA